MCIDTQSSDRNNCGGCGVKCGANEVCDVNTCLPCPPATPYLVNGQCQQCPEGQIPGTGTDKNRCVLDCNIQYPNGGYIWCSGWSQCIKDENTDCGACGNKCPLGQSCVNSACSGTISTCAPNPLDTTGQSCINCSNGDGALCASCINKVSTCS